MNNEDRRRVVKEALRTRARIQTSDGTCFCIYDAVRKIGVDVRFLALDSLEGMYCRAVPPTIIVSSRRPDGRQRFTCAHELSHHVLGHGESIDPIAAADTSRQRSPEETQADLFAGHLLMPPSLVPDMLRAHGVTAGDATPLQVYAVASAIGVGYSTLITHMSHALRICPERHRVWLERTSPKDIRATLGVPGEVDQMVLVGESWRGRPIDVASGGYVVATKERAELLRPASCLVLANEKQNFIFFRAGEPSTSLIGNPTIPSVRVYPREFEGRATFRFDSREGK